MRSDVEGNFRLEIYGHKVPGRKFPSANSGPQIFNRKIFGYKIQGLKLCHKFHNVWIDSSCFVAIFSRFRLGWSTDNRNAQSNKAAARFGFVFEAFVRQQYVQKNSVSDTVWYSIIDEEWPIVKQACEEWLDPSNFDENGVQKKRLTDIRERVMKEMGGRLGLYCLFFLY